MKLRAEVYATFRYQGCEMVLLLIMMSPLSKSFTGAFMDETFISLISMLP